MRKEYLKIRDDVDLKELEKFGFKAGYIEYKDLGIKKTLICYSKETTDFTQTFNGEIISKYDGGLEVFCKTREIFLNTEQYVGNLGRYGLETLFDLISAGLVEKVVEDE